MSQIETIYNKLKSKGISVYMPNIKIGECKTPYVVIKYDGSSQVLGYSTVQDYYTVMCYVPEDRYSDLDKYVHEIEKIMHELQPEIVSVNTKTPSFYDAPIKAHMVSMRYRNYKKISGIINRT